MPTSSSLLSPASPLTLPAPSVSQASHASSAGLRHAAGEFESMLLTQWLQAAEDTFGSVPGADEDQDGADTQMKSFAVQALAKGITAVGGIGLSALVSQALSREGNHATEAAEKASTGLPDPATTQSSSGVKP